MTTEEDIIISQRALVWGLKQLCLWGELAEEEAADPHLRGEAAYTAKVTIDQLAYQISQGTDS
jgi:hypothetical protein